MEIHVCQILRGKSVAPGCRYGSTDKPQSFSDFSLIHHRSNRINKIFRYERPLIQVVLPSLGKSKAEA